MMLLTAWELPGVPNKKRHRFRCLFLSQRKSACNKKSLLWCIEYGILSASRNILLEILRISFFCGWDVKLSIGWSEKVEPQGDFPPAVLPSQAVPGKYFRPHLVNWDDFAPSMTSARITPPPAVAAYRLTPELSGFSHIWDKLASISLNGCVLRFSNISRLRKLSLCSLT